MSSARSTSDCRGPVTRKEFRIGRSQGNLARTTDVAVVISLNNFLGPVDDTVTVQKMQTSTSTKWWVGRPAQRRSESGHDGGWRLRVAAVANCEAADRSVGSASPGAAAPGSLASVKST